MKKRLAITKDGRVSMCSCPESKMGRGRCNHVAVYNQEVEELNQSLNKDSDVGPQGYISLEKLYNGDPPFAERIQEAIDEGREPVEYFVGMNEIEKGENLEKYFSEKDRNYFRALILRGNFLERYARSKNQLQKIWLVVHMDRDMDHNSKEFKDLYEILRHDPDKEVASSLEEMGLEVDHPSGRKILLHSFKPTLEQQKSNFKEIPEGQDKIRALDDMSQEVRIHMCQNSKDFETLTIMRDLNYKPETTEALNRLAELGMTGKKWDSKRKKVDRKYIYGNS